MFLAYRGYSTILTIPILLLLTYGSVSLFVVAFVLYPIADSLFRDAQIPKYDNKVALGLEF